jgi:hypothetical protein
MINQKAKKVAFGDGHKAIKDVSVFTHMEMSEDLNHLAGRRQFVVTGERNENLVTNSAYVQDSLGWQRTHQATAQECNHVLFRIRVRSTQRPLAMSKPRVENLR